MIRVEGLGFRAQGVGLRVIIATLLINPAYPCSSK